MLQLHKTFLKHKVDFSPLNPPTVTVYSCGPTVYDYMHVGHARKYVIDDVLVRTLEFLGYQPKHIVNITDVGHLVSDADEGEDKLEKGAAKYGKSVEEVVKYFSNDFFEMLKLLNIRKASQYPRASEHITQQIKMIETLIAKGHAYETQEAVYFDISTFPQYSSLFGQDLEEKQHGVRDEVEMLTSKRNPADFVLWFKRVGKYENHILHWQSPWGEGFPGWHIECSAMSMEYLGETIDIHTGGVDHMSVHHPNEIAQSESATNKPFVRFWLHCEFLLIDGQKMSKSLGNFLRPVDVVQKGIDPLALRYFFFTSHYRKQQNFTWEALEGAQNALHRLRNRVSLEASETKDFHKNVLSGEALKWEAQFNATLEDDLNMPQSLAVLWEMMDSSLSKGEKLRLLMKFDDVLGLGIFTGNVSIPDEVSRLADLRIELRTQKKFAESDAIRDEILALGYEVKDTQDGFELRKV